MLLAEAPAQAAVTGTAADPRARLISAMARTLAAKGYAELTIADVVAEAGVSRRTFYEHFDGKPACFIALYQAATHQSLNVLRQALDPARPWHAQVPAVLGAYLGTLAASPALTRTLLVEVLQLGTEGLVARRRAHEELATLVAAIVNAAPQGQGPSSSLTQDLALAIVGGIHELVLARIEAGETAAIGELTRSAAEFVLRVAGSRAA